MTKPSNTLVSAKPTDWTPPKEVESIITPAMRLEEIKDLDKQVGVCKDIIEGDYTEPLKIIARATLTKIGPWYSIVQI